MALIATSGKYHNANTSLDRCMESSGLVVAKLWFGSRQTRGLFQHDVDVSMDVYPCMDLGTWIYQMEMEPRITTSCMCGEGCATMTTASHAHQCAVTWQARSPQGLQKSTAMMWPILTSMQEIYLSMVSWQLRHVCVIWPHGLGNCGAGGLPPGHGCRQWGGLMWPCDPSWLCSYGSILTLLYWVSR